MQVSRIMVLAAFLGLAAYQQDSVVQGVKLSVDLSMTDFNGADEDEIMEKVFNKYCIEGKDHSGEKNGKKILMKSTAPKAAGVILEATHKLKGAQVPGYIKANFDKTWERFDINSDGFIGAEETHTFMRSLMGKLNKFALAPGSLSDIGIGGDTKPKTEAKTDAAQAPADTEKPAPKKTSLATKKKEEKPAADASTDDAAASKDATDGDSSASSGAASDDTNVEI